MQPSHSLLIVDDAPINLQLLADGIAEPRCRSVSLTAHKDCSLSMGGSGSVSGRFFRRVDAYIADTFETTGV